MKTVLYFSFVALTIFKHLNTSTSASSTCLTCLYFSCWVQSFCGFGVNIQYTWTKHIFQHAFCIKAVNQSRHFLKNVPSCKKSVYLWMEHTIILNFIIKAPFAFSILLWIWQSWRCYFLQMCGAYYQPLLEHSHWSI